MINLLDVSAIQRRAKALAAQLGKRDFNIRSSSTHDGSPHIEVLDDVYSFVVCERGAEMERRTSKDLDDLLFWILENLTSNLAWNFELKHRRDSEDSRRQAFAKQTELLSLLSPEWGERQKAAQEEILMRYPFRDS